MTWEEQLAGYLDDLEQQAEGAFAEDRAAEVSERARSEYATVPLAARLMAGIGDDLALRVNGVGEITGRLARVADGWCLLASTGQEWLVRLTAVAVARGLPARAVPVEAWPVTARLGFGSALRGLAEEGGPCRVLLRDGTSYALVPGRVGLDFVEGRPEGGGPPLLVAFDAIAAVQRRDL